MPFSVVFLVVFAYQSKPERSTQSKRDSKSLLLRGLGPYFAEKCFSKLDYKLNCFLGGARMFLLKR